MRLQKIDYSSYKKPSDYMKFEEGQNRIRVVSNGGMGLQHGIKTLRGWINLGLCDGENCQQCAKGNEAKRFWRWLVWDYRDQDVKILDAGPMIGNQICEMAKELSEDPQKYDLIITRKGLGLKTQYQVAKASDEQPRDEKRINIKKRYLINKYFGEK